MIGWLLILAQTILTCFVVYKAIQTHRETRWMSTGLDKLYALEKMEETLKRSGLSMNYSVSGQLEILDTKIKLLEQYGSKPL